MKGFFFCCFALLQVDSSWICIDFSRAHCTSQLIPRASLCFPKWNTRCRSELKWDVKMLLRKPSLKDAAGTLLLGTCSVRRIEQLVFMAGKPPAYELTRNIFSIFRSCSRFEQKEFSVAGEIGGLSLLHPLLQFEFLIPQQWCFVFCFVFFNKRLTAGSGVVCTSSTK